MKSLCKIFEQLNIPYDMDLLNKYEGYMEYILLLNQSINLTAITQREEFIKKHYIDSLIIGELEDFVKASRVIDVGTGAGFPGIPLALAYPNKEFVLMDSLKKRLSIIDSLTQKYGIDNVTTIHSRAEELAINKAYREKFDVCISRAVANLPVLSEYTLPFVRIGGSSICYKGPDAIREIDSSHKAIKVLGGEEPKVYNPFIIDNDNQHNLIIIKKIKNTPAKYPRKAGTPSKEPII